MNNVDYLNSISNKNKQQTTSGKSLLDNKIFRIAAIAIAAFAIISIVFSILGDIRNRPRTYLEQLNLRTISLSEVTEEYNDSLKSPEIRSAGVSFAATIKGLSANLADVYKANGISDKSSSSAINDIEAKNTEDMNTTLEYGRINGILDRTYAHEMAYQTSLLIAIIETAQGVVTNPDTLDALDNTKTSLEQLHSMFDNFSDVQK